MNFSVISAITRKDVVDAIRHRYLLTALVTPLFVALMFRVILPGDTGRSILNVVVHDAGSSALVAELRNTPRIGVIEATSADAIAGDVQKRKTIGGLAVPARMRFGTAASLDAQAGSIPHLPPGVPPSAAIPAIARPASPGRRPGGELS